MKIVTILFGNGTLVTLPLIHQIIFHMINIQERKKKTERLTPKEFEALKKYVETLNTVIDAAAAIGVHRNTLDLVLIKGKGSPETIEKIRAKLNPEPARA